jgi:hypothetical protein
MSNKGATHAKNATYLFEGKYKERTWPSSSESFWTALFALFVLHLATGSTPRGRLTVWHCTDGSNNKWYKPRAVRPSLEFTDLTFDSIAIEPRVLPSPWPGTQHILDTTVGGFSPDIVIRSPDLGRADQFIVIENKIAGYLAPNQCENYPRLAGWLVERGTPFDFLLLQSAGCHKTLHEQARCFQREPWGSNFGILLWEEVLREMLRTEFTLAGLPVQSWHVYTEALESDCVK